MIGQQMPASFDTARGREPTLCRAGIAAEKNGLKLATGSRFLCPRLGPMTREKCLGNFQAGHSACTTGFVCGIGRLEAEKEGLDVGYNTKKGDCACGTKDVQLDKHGRCYKCQAAIREEARRLARMTPAASEDATPPVAPSEAAPSIQAVQGGCPADLQDDPDLSDDLDLPDAGYAPGVTAVVETLPPEGQLVGDEDPVPGDCQGWPETAGTLVIDGMEFEVIPSGKNASIGRPVVSFRSAAIAFSADAVRKHGLDKYSHVRMHKAPGAVCFEVMAKPGANARKLHRQQKDAASLACTIHNLKDIFPGLTGRRFDLEATGRPGFFLARVG